MGKTWATDLYAQNPAQVILNYFTYLAAAKCTVENKSKLTNSEQ